MHWSPVCTCDTCGTKRITLWTDDFARKSLEREEKSYVGTGSSVFRRSGRRAALCAGGRIGDGRGKWKDYQRPARGNIEGVAHPPGCGERREREEGESGTSGVEVRC